MTAEITNQLEEYIKKEQALFNALRLLKSSKQDIKSQIGKTLLQEGLAELAADLFESPKARKIGRKLAQTFIDQSQKDQISTQYQTIENQHDSIVQNMKNFLSSISIVRKYKKESNSIQLIKKIEKAQLYMKIDTRIRKTILTLREIMSKQLTWNKDVPRKTIEKEIIIQPIKPFTAITNLTEILRNIEGYLKILDPYVDSFTLELLLSVPENTPIKLLTMFTGGKRKSKQFIKACKKFRKERSKFEIKKCQDRIHDRFILDETNGWSIGTSLKDIGNKLSMIKQITPKTKHQIEEEFDKLWKTAIKVSI